MQPTSSVMADVRYGFRQIRQSWIRGEIRALDRSAPVPAVGTVDAEPGMSLARRRFQAWLLAMFSLLAVLLAAVMGLAVLVACAVPAWRAARIDPTLTLRQDG